MLGIRKLRLWTCTGKIGQLSKIRKHQPGRPPGSEVPTGALGATQTPRARTDLLVAVVIFVATAAVGLLLGRLFGADVELIDVGAVAAASAVVALVIIVWTRLVPRTGTHRFSVVIGAVFTGVGLFAISNAASRWVDFIGYGDTGFLGSWIERGDGPFSHWLGASGLLEWVYVALWRSPFLGELIPQGPAGADLLVVLVGAATTAVCAVGVALVYGRRFPFAVAFTLFSPIFVMFALGYDEVYPLVAGPFVVFLFWFFSRPLDERDPAAVGIWLGGLSIAYLPFVIPGSVIGLGLLVLRPRKALRMVVAGAATVVTGIVVFWPAGVTDFFRTLHADLNLGDKHTLFPRFIGHASGSNSIFFSAYLLAAFFAGVALDWYWSQSGEDRQGALVIGMTYAGAACAAVILLVLVGIPPAYP